jgi:hypothetical protein
VRLDKFGVQLMKQLKGAVGRPGGSVQVEELEAAMNKGTELEVILLEYIPECPVAVPFASPQTGQGGPSFIATFASGSVVRMQMLRAEDKSAH